MMKKYKKIENYSSEVIDDVLHEDKLELAKTRNKMQLAANIEDYMEHLKWNKSELAAKMGRHPSEISKWFSGTHNFTIETLTEIAFTFDVELNQLFKKVNVRRNIVLYTGTVKQAVSPIRLYTPFNPRTPAENYTSAENRTKRRSKSGSSTNENVETHIQLVSE